MDLYGESPAKMVAELKVLGNGYAPKCFDGTGRIPECFHSAGEGSRVMATRKHLSAAIGYFLHDVNRLRAVCREYERYMILVVDKRPPMDRLGRALLTVKVANEELTVESPDNDWLARIWTL